eukprot:260378-Chlamydomonas_euryale.AAC.1
MVLPKDHLTALQHASVQHLGLAQFAAVLQRRGGAGRLYETGIDGGASTEPRQLAVVLQRRRG